MKAFIKKYRFLISLMTLSGGIFSMPMAASAEAMRGIFNESGIYAGPDGSWKFGLFGIPNSVLMTQPVDPTAPEGARVIHIVPVGGVPAWGVYYVDSDGVTTKPRDFSDYENGYIRFWMRNSQDVRLDFKYFDANRIEITKSATVGANGWREITIHLDSAFYGSDVTNLSRITVPFSMRSTGGTNAYDVDDIRWIKMPTGLKVFPTDVLVNPGKHRQFTVEGTDSNGEFLLVGTTFSVPSSAGTMSPAPPSSGYSGILTAGTGSGQLTITKRRESVLSGQLLVLNANVNITSSNLEAQYGLLSETYTGALLGGPTPNSELNVFSGGPDGINPVITDISSNLVEGSAAQKITVNMSDPNSFAGWTIVQGVGTPDTDVLNMSNYYDGSIRFWFKGPAVLQDKVSVGIRSGNVPGGQEVSKALLKDYGVVFNDQWQAVVIPLKDFARARPFADLSRIKNLFTMSVVGNTSGVQSLFIDNLRWDTTQLGPLASITVLPNPVTVPLNSKRVFTARGFDATGNSLDIAPTWTQTGSLGTLIPNGNSTLLQAGGSPTSGLIQAQVGSITATANVSVAAIIFNQEYNIYSDIGLAAQSIGISKGPAGPTNMVLNELTGDAFEGNKYMHTTYTLTSVPAASKNAFAVWFVEDQLPSRFMSSFEVGYLRFYVRTDRDLQVSIRSSNITPGAEGKIRLSELGIPLDNTWQEVIIALADFKVKNPSLDFSQIKNYFTIGVLSGQIGDQNNKTFDIDKVQWLTTASGIENGKIYLGLKEKQNSSTGLVRSFNGQANAFTYDQSLAAMAYIYRSPSNPGDINLATKLFDTYKNNFFTAGSFAGFADNYNVDTKAIISSDRTAGPNAFMLLALTHYRNVTGDTTYDAMADGIANWLLTLKDTDGAIKFGTSGTVPAGTKSTEHNFDVMSAFKAYARTRSAGTAAPFNAAVTDISNWLLREAFSPAQQRFFVGEKPSGVADTDKALDLYSLPMMAFASAPLSPSTYTAILNNAVNDFENKKISAVTGALVDGFDFGANIGQQPDKDAVWLEGTAQIVLAYRLVGNQDQADYFSNELRKAVFTPGSTGSQALPYATNSGTAYSGYLMNSADPAVSSMAWYLFSQDNFNVLAPYQQTLLVPKNIATHDVATDITWPSILPGTGWTVASQYAELGAQGISSQLYGIQIYTDNTNPSETTRFVDLTPGTTSNADSQPSGLLATQTVGRSVLATSSRRLPLAWSIKDSTKTVGAAGSDGIMAAEPNDVTATPPDLNSAQWLYIKDVASPDIDDDQNGILEGTKFVNGEPFVRVRQNNTIHATQANDGFFVSTASDYVYFQADFRTAFPQVIYKTKIYFDYFNE